MHNPLEFRMGELIRRSEHYRQLADGLLSRTVSAEIAAVAEEYEGEVLRMQRECRGKRGCPCNLSRRCFPIE